MVQLSTLYTDPERLHSLKHSMQKNAYIMLTCRSRNTVHILFLANCKIPIAVRLAISATDQILVQICYHTKTQTAASAGLVTQKNN